MTTKRMIGFCASAMLMAMVAIPAFGQAPPPGGGQGGGPGGRFDPARFRQVMMDRIKETLGSSDDEFKALEPKIDQVLTAQRDARGFGMGRRGGPGAGPGGGDNQPTTPVQEKTKELQDALDSKDTKPEDLKAKLAALREARAKAKE